MVVGRCVDAGAEVDVGVRVKGGGSGRWAVQKCVYVCASACARAL